MPDIKILRNYVSHTLSGLNLQKACGADGVSPIVLKNRASELTPCLVKLFHLCLSKSTFPSCWKFVHMQLVPKKGDRSTFGCGNLSGLFCLSISLCFALGHHP